MWWDGQECVYDWNDADEPHDRLVIIGNGFDLECGLPTSYADFLKFVSALEDMREGIHDDLLRSLLAGAHRKQINNSTSIKSLDDYFELIQVRSANNVLKTVFFDFIDAVFDREGVCKSIIEVVKSGYDQYCETNNAEMSTATLRAYLYSTFYARLFNNCWYKHFVTANIGSGWVDIENEIASIIWSIEDTMIHAGPRQKTLDDTVVCTSLGTMSSLIKGLFELEKGLHPALTPQTEENCTVLNHFLRSNGVTYRKLRAKLLDDLNVFVAAYENYLRDYVEHMTATRTPTINKIIESLRSVTSLENSHVISFNYTSTLERMLAKEGIDVDVCYVNGRIGTAQDKNATCKLVLGMDEHLDDADISSMTDFAMFRKYNQRIYKRTDSSYAKWLRAYEGEQVSHEVILMGHSLTASDHGLLRRVFSLPGTRAAIYYKDDDSFGGLLANLTAMMGKDYLIERTLADKHTLEFVDQREL
ncbi:MAG: hypothetical protein J6S63_02090 [Atopobiaceae bacterium]|nr:hypothetical protein [Atopobiaceae bacterium]